MESNNRMIQLRKMKVGDVMVLGIIPDCLEEIKQSLLHEGTASQHIHDITTIQTTLEILIKDYIHHHNLKETEDGK